MAEVKLFGYCNHISVKPGDEQTFHVTADGTDSAEAQLVRLIHGDQHPDGPGVIEEEVGCEINGTWDVKKQYTQVGSYLEVADPENRLCVDGSFSMFAYIWPSLHPKVGATAVFGRYDDYNSVGYGIGIDPSGKLLFIVGDGKEFDHVEAEIPLQRHIWYFIGASYDAATGRATLYQSGVVNRYNSLWGKVTPMDYDSHVSEVLRFKPEHAPDISFLVGGTWDEHSRRGKFVNELYSGKIDRPGMVSRALSRAEFDQICMGGKPPENDILTYWDTTVGYTDSGIGDIVMDTGPHGLHATGVNKPVRAQTGWNWSGRNDCFRLAPEEYGGIELHDDAVIDCGWDVTNRLTIPDDLKSGVYAIRLRAGDGTGLGEEYLVFFVRAKTPKAPIALLIPTASYLAYANARLTFDAEMAQPIVGQTPIVSEIDIEVYQSPDFGMSTYDHHRDGAGVCYSSYRRPIVDMRPKYRNPMTGVTWQFPADLSIVAWLEHCNYDYEVLTDEDLHLEGADAILPYKCVITGTHPEYYSEIMLDATEDFVAGGGRLIYMGGNGYYWNVNFCEEEPWCMEVRKLDSGMRAWNAKPGEHYMQTTGQKGGLWRNLGRPPQKALGVGFISQGFESARPYRRMPDSWHRTVSWITEGVEGEIIGDFGLAHGGAGGIEMDRYDLEKGTPPHAKIIASSGGHTDNYTLVCEEVLYAFPGMTGTYDHRIRADMVYFTSSNNGAVFSTGSIAYGQALPVNDFDNNVSQVLQNVMNAFIKEGSLPGKHWSAEEKQWQ